VTVYCPNCHTRIVTRKTAKADKRAKRKSDDALIRSWIIGRSAGTCENCGKWGGETLQVDHFFGRSRDRSLSGCWALCVDCHFEKTNNRPSRAIWIQRFMFRAIALGHKPAVAKCLALIAKDEGKRAGRVSSTGSAEDNWRAEAAVNEVCPVPAPRPGNKR